MSLDSFVENFSIDLDDEEPDTLDCEEKGIDALPEGVLSAPRLASVEGSKHLGHHLRTMLLKLALHSCIDCLVEVEHWP